VCRHAYAWCVPAWVVTYRKLPCVRSVTVRRLGRKPSTPWRRCASWVFQAQGSSPLDRRTRRGGPSGILSYCVRQYAPHRWDTR
jgi:hypothetical protein